MRFGDLKKDDFFYLNGMKCMKLRDTGVNWLQNNYRMPGHRQGFLPDDAQVDLNNPQSYKYVVYFGEIWRNAFPNDVPMVNARGKDHAERIRERTGGFTVRVRQMRNIT